MSFVLLYLQLCRNANLVVDVKPQSNSISRSISCIGVGGEGRGILIRDDLVLREHVEEENLQVFRLIHASKGIVEEAVYVLNCTFLVSF